MDYFTDLTDISRDELDRYAVDTDYDSDLGDLAREFAALSPTSRDE